MDIRLKLQHGLLAVETEHHVHGMVELVAPEQKNDGVRRDPLHLALVVDRSGSMAGEKLEVTKRCAEFLVNRLQTDDELALVAYDDTVTMLAPLAPVDVDRLTAQIRAIPPGGMTNLSGGWLKGVEELQRRDGGVRRVILLTDGLANEGITDGGQLKRMSEEVAGGGITTTTVGFGEGFDEELLTGMSDAGRGGAWFAETPDDAPGIFSQEFEGLISLAAQNVSVEFRPTGDVAMLGVLNDYPAVEVDGGLQVMVGDAYAGHRLRVVFQLAIPDLAALGVRKVADVVIRYVSVGEQVEQHTVTKPLVVNMVSAEEAEGAAADDEVTEEVTVLLSARATDEARRLADRGDFEEASEALHSAMESLQAVAPASGRADELVHKLEDLRRTRDEMSAEAWSPSSSKRLHYRSHELKRRRGGPGPRDGGS